MSRRSWHTDRRLHMGENRLIEVDPAESLETFGPADQLEAFGRLPQHRGVERATNEVV